MKTIKEIDESDARGLFGSEIFLRGKEYFEEGNVTNIELLDDKTISGTVVGNNEYKVSITIDSDGDISCECSCPCDFNCKHAAALLLKWIEEKNKIKKNENTTPLRPLLKETLNKMPKENLIELISLLVEKKPELRALITIDGKKIISQIRSIFSDFIPENEVREVISELETILEGIKRNAGIWNKELFEHMWTGAKIMINNYENIHDEGDLGIFLEEWFETLGEVFAKTNPNQNEKQEFIDKIFELIKKEEYGNESSYEQAFLGMCTSKEDLILVKKALSQLCKSKDYCQLSDYDEFFLKMYDKLGLTEDFLGFANKTGLSNELIDKLISINKLQEALVECNKSEKKARGSNSKNEIIERKKIIFEKLGKSKEMCSCLFELSKNPFEISSFIELKTKCPAKDFKKYFDSIVSWAEKNKEKEYLSRIYFHEKDYSKAFEYSDNIKDFDYLELLAKKLEQKNNLLACKVYRKLIFGWINSGTGYHYKKAGEFLQKIKLIDKDKTFFNKTKAEIFSMHKKKYSLMAIISKT